MRCDVFGDEHFMGTTNFNPRTSYEMRRDAFFKCSMHLNDFNPRTSYEMRPLHYGLLPFKPNISIHAPRMRCDAHPEIEQQIIVISIHAPRMRCDGFFTPFSSALVYFNPRTSYEMRREVSLNELKQILFQSTHLV